MKCVHTTPCNTWVAICVCTHMLALVAAMSKLEPPSRTSSWRLSCFVARHFIRRVAYFVLSSAALSSTCSFGLLARPWVWFLVPAASRSSPGARGPGTCPGAQGQGTDDLAGEQTLWFLCCVMEALAVNLDCRCTSPC